MLSKDLEYTLNVAFRRTRELRHEFMTVEHLLHALIENPSARDALIACGIVLEKLDADLSTYINETTPVLSAKDERETQPTLGFQRVLQRAVFHVQSSGRKEVDGVNVLIAIFGERESQAVAFLAQQDMTRLDIVNFASHGISKVGEKPEAEGQWEPRINVRVAIPGQEVCANRLSQDFASYSKAPERPRHVRLVGPCGSGKEVLVSKVAKEFQLPCVSIDAQNILSSGEDVFHWMYRRIQNELKKYRRYEVGIVLIERAHTLIGSSPRRAGALDVVVAFLGRSQPFVEETSKRSFAPLVILSLDVENTELPPSIPESIRTRAPHEVIVEPLEEKYLHWLMVEESVLGHYTTLIGEYHRPIRFDVSFGEALTSWAVRSGAGLSGVYRVLDELAFGLSAGVIRCEAVVTKGHLDATLVSLDYV